MKIVVLSLALASLFSVQALARGESRGGRRHADCAPSRYSDEPGWDSRWYRCTSPRLRYPREGFRQEPPFYSPPGFSNDIGPDGTLPFTTQGS